MGKDGSTRHKRRSRPSRRKSATYREFGDALVILVGNKVNQEDLQEAEEELQETACGSFCAFINCRDSPALISPIEMSCFREVCVVWRPSDVKIECCNSLFGRLRDTNFSQQNWLACEIYESINVAV